jgi:hypothetical protein
MSLRYGEIGSVMPYSGDSLRTVGDLNELTRLVDDPPADGQLYLRWSRVRA